MANIPSYKSPLLTLLVILFNFNIATANDQQLSAALFDSKPIAYHDDNGQIAGLMPDFIRLLSAQTGITIDIHIMPYGRMLNALAAGNHDFSIFYYSEATEPLVESLVKLEDAHTIVIGLKGTEINRYEDLSSLRIAVPRMIFYDPRFDNDSKLHKIKASDHRASIRFLLSGRADAVAGSETGIRYQMALLGLDNELLGEPYTLSSNEIWLRFSRKSNKQHLKPALLKAAQALQQKGEFVRLFRQHTAVE